MHFECHLAGYVKEIPACVRPQDVVVVRGSVLLFVSFSVQCFVTWGQQANKFILRPNLSSNHSITIHYIQCNAECFVYLKQKVAPFSLHVDHNY